MESGEIRCSGCNCGALDPEKALPEFLSALEAAGMDKILEEQQKQFDIWLAEQDK